MVPPQQQNMGTNYYHPQVNIPEMPAPPQSQVMQLQANLRNLQRLRLFHGGSLDDMTTPGDPNMQWDTSPLIPDISIRGGTPLFPGPSFVAPGQRLPEQHDPQIDERMSQASSLNTYPENAAPGYHEPSSGATKSSSCGRE